ncbi:MAG: protein-L-isoaspartate(D-aspartate) O-methyltransferase [Paracoccaceae bacterium]
MPEITDARVAHEWFLWQNWLNKENPILDPYSKRSLSSSMTDFTALRTAMVDCQIRPSDVTKFPIIEAMLLIRREQFVPTGMRDVAYAGDHIQLGKNRVVLDPRVLAKMLDALEIQPDELVLDVACGLGYCAAVIGHLAEAVIAVEEDEALASEAETNLADEAVDNAVVVAGPLIGGAAKHGPYDVIAIPGGVQEIPSDLLAQLKDGGRIGAVFVMGEGGQGAGQFRVGIKTPNGVAWRNVFDATAPLLPGFEREVDFAL